MLYANSDFDNPCSEEHNHLLRALGQKYWIKYAEHVLTTAIDDVTARNVITFPLWYKLGNEGPLGKVQPFIDAVPIEADRCVCVRACVCVCGLRLCVRVTLGLTE